MCKYHTNTKLAWHILRFHKHSSNTTLGIHQMRDICWIDHTCLPQNQPSCDTSYRPRSLTLRWPPPYAGSLSVSQFIKKHASIGLETMTLSAIQCIRRRQVWLWSSQVQTGTWRLQFFSQTILDVRNHVRCQERINVMRLFNKYATRDMGWNYSTLATMMGSPY